MAPRCCYNGCKNKKTKGNKDVRFIPFPKPNPFNLTKCQEWFAACRPRQESYDEFIRKLSRNVYVCSDHFINSSGPTTENPNPVCSSKFRAPPTIEAMNQTVVPAGWTIGPLGNGTFIFSKIDNEIELLSCKISSDLTYDVKVLYESAPEDFLKTLPNLATVEDIPSLLHALNLTNVCKGNREECLKNAFKKSHSKKGVYQEKTKTIHSIQCKKICSTQHSQRCTSCTLYRKSLKSMASNLAKNRTGLRSLSRQQLITKIRLVEAKQKQANKTILKILKSKKIHQNNPETADITEKTFVNCFLAEQMKLRKMKAKGRRWSSDSMKWITYIKNKSPSTYDALKKSGVLILPSKKTLFNQNRVLTNKPGIHADVIKKMVDSFNLKNLEEHQKYFSLLIDEMSIREDVIYNPETGNYTGFVDLGPDIIPENKEPVIATHVLQFMVQGITTNLKYPFAFFATNNLKGEDLFKLIWKAIEMLELHGCKILAIVGDGAVPNRKFFTMCHKPESNKTDIHFYTKNIYASIHNEERNIYFVSDPPHLIKTTRNCFASSGIGSKKFQRDLWINGENIHWSTIVNLYNEDIRRPVRFVNKLTYSNVFLTSFSKMKVNYAAQILSRTLAAAIKKFRGEEEYAETIRFILTFNKYFDVLNTRSIKECIHKRNMDLAPYWSETDERLLWLKNDFINYLNEWEASVAKREGKFKATERAKMKISPQTILGLKMTALSAVEIISFCLKMGAKFVLFGHVNQDNLENLFGRHRAACGSSDNPTVWHYQANLDKLRDLKEVALDPVGGNTEVQVEDATIDAT